MSWVNVRAGLVEVLEGVPGIKAVTTSVPQSVDDWPFGYVINVDGEYRYPANRQVKGMYHGVFRVVFPYSDPQAAEDYMAPFINSVPDTLIQRVQMAGRLRNGSVMCTRYEYVRVPIADVTYLGLDFHIQVEDKYEVNNGVDI